MLDDDREDVQIRQIADDGLHRLQAGQCGSTPGAAPAAAVGTTSVEIGGMTEELDDGGESAFDGGRAHKSNLCGEPACESAVDPEDYSGVQ